MKYAIVIPDGCADDPCPSLDGRTPLQAARLPNMDRIARDGLCGLTNNVPASLTPASDVATLSLFGYDPLEVYTGRAPLEAAALGVRLGPGDWAIRCNFVCIENGTMGDFTAGHVTNEEGRNLVDDLRAHLPAGFEIHPGVSYRNLLVYRGDPIFDHTLKTQPPHDIPNQPVGEFVPSGPGSGVLQQIMDRSREIFADHPVNARRRGTGKRPATQVWLWGQGQAPRLTPFFDIHGLRGAISTSVDLVRGVGTLLGWDRLEAPGITDYIDTDYRAQGQLAIEHLDKYDLMCVHIEAPDEASHAGLVDEKVKSLEQIDEHIVGPLLEVLPRFGDWRILVAPDHRTPLTTRAHSHGAVPFAIAGTGVSASQTLNYDEVHAESGRRFDPGWKLMSWFLKGQS